MELKAIEDIINLFDYNLKRRITNFRLAPKLIRNVIKLARAEKAKKGNLSSPYIKLSTAAKQIADKEKYSFEYTYQKIRKAALRTGEYIQRGAGFFIEKKKVKWLFSYSYKELRKAETVEDLENEDFLVGVHSDLRSKNLSATVKRLQEEYGLTAKQIEQYNFFYKRAQ